MLKPLLRTLPTLSGNIKIACELTDIEKIDEQNSQAYVRYAKLLPLSSKLAQRNCEVSLLQSSYEFDIKNFYKYYNDIFFDDCFEVNKSDYEKIDKYNAIKQRNTDFEFGCKRVSFEKSGNQFAFYAPIYLESDNDLPDYFLLTINLKNEIYTAKRTIKVNICRNSNNKNNYLYSYLKRYAEKIDNNVIYCLPKTQQATYYGINLSNGGFIRVVDNLISKIYNKQLTINNFDTAITTGWKRNKICMKQILPLSFYFNINDILTDNDKIKFANTKATITGAYYKNGEEVKFYNIDTDYVYLRQDPLRFNELTGIIDYVRGKENILDVGYPSLNDCNFVKYKYSNKVSPMYNRWKLKYSSDEHPYITNMSFGFSHNQDSIYKYGEFPETYEQLTIVADDENNIVLPLSKTIYSEGSPYYQNYGLLENYKSIMNKYASTWFDVIADIDTYKLVHLNNPVDVIDGVEYFRYNNDKYEQLTSSELADIKRRLGLPLYDPNHLLEIDLYQKDTLWYDHEWTDVTDDKTYYKGILYDLSNIYKSISDIDHIDKFGVFVRLNFEPLQKTMLNNIKSAKYSIFNSNKYIKNKNCFVSKTVPLNFSSGDFDNNVSSFFISEGTAVKEELNYKSLFLEETEGDGDFIDLLNYGFNYYNVNRYYKLSEIKYVLSDPNCGFPYVFEELVDKTLNSEQYFVDGYELLPIYRLSEVFDDNEHLLFENEKKGNGEWLTKSLYFSHNGNLYKNLYAAKSLEEMYKDYKDTEFAVPLYIKDIFISHSSLETIFYETLTKEVADRDAIPYIKLLTEYEFNPVVEYNDNVIAKNIFTRRDTFTGRTYGDSIPTVDIEADKNVIYVDPYNLNQVIDNYNSRFGTSIPLYETTSGEKLNNINSCEFFAKFLNEFHLKYYFNNLYNNLSLTEDPSFALNSIYIKKRLILNNYESKNLFVKDEYTPLTDFYIVYVSKIVKNGYTKYESYYDWKASISESTFEEILKNSITQELFEFVCESDKDIQIYLNDIYKENLASLIWRLINDSEYQTQYESQIYNRVSNDIITDIIYNKEGYWTFSDRFNETQDVDKVAGVPELNETYTSTFKFELVYKKCFIKVNENIYNMINLENVNNLPYKDLYLYVIEEPEAYPKSLQFYYTDDLSKLNTTYETTACLVPLFNDVFLQNKKETAVYVEYNKNNVTPTTYLYNQSQYGKYYRYAANNVNIMYDISNYPDDGYPMIGHDIYTGETAYYYPKSYIDKYQITGARALTTYNLLDNCTSYISKATTYVSEEETYVVSTHIDYEHPQIGVSVTYTYYTENMFNRIYPEDIEGHRPIDTYDYISDTTDPHYGQYTVYTSISYEYYPEYIETGTRYAYHFREYDDIGAYDTFKLSSYTVPYTYTYSYVTTTEVTERRVDPEGKWMSYEITYLVEKDAIGYATGYSTYGFFLIDANLDNTGASFNVVDKEYRQKKYFTYINQNDIYEDDYSLNDMFNIILPFTQLQLLETLFNDNQLVMKPMIYNIDTHYRQTPLYDASGQQYAYDIMMQSKSLGSLSHERYMDALVPYIKETTVIENAYSLKFKEVESTFDVNYNKSSIYNDKLGIYRYSPVRIYNVDNSYELYYPVEYKYFNDNVLINLEETIEIHVSDSLTYGELLENEQEDIVISAFRNYINYNQKNTYTEDEILFLYNRYNVEYKSVCVGLNSKKTEKLYSLTYKFTLL